MMTWIVHNLWLIPFLPLLAAGVLAVTKRPHRRLASSLAIGALGVGFLLSCVAFFQTLGERAAETGPARSVFNFNWLQFGEANLQLGWVLDPLSAVMLIMVTFVGALIFIYSVGYMAHDDNFTRFFCFMSLFAAAMLGLVIANSLLLLFICWELVGLASYLLIGFWYQKPSAAAAAKKAFITTRIGDLGFLIGMLWLYAQTGTLLFYDNGAGCLEQSALSRLVGQTTLFGMAVSTGISLLIFCGAIGKSGQVPLHVWLPDAMEGPTPVSALIHAATMVAAGVFLVARVYPLMAAHLEGTAVETDAFKVITWIGAITAVFAACIAVAQNDIKRILAYSTVSQLGYMMMGLGVGGVAVGMFHLITHAFFKALLFMGAGSVIHGCHDEQDIRKMGGLRKFMPVTFATYAVGMMALSGVPLFFSGFWSKDEILHAAHAWPASQIPFFLGLFGAFLTAFYMTRQMCYVFGGAYRGEANATQSSTPHESPSVMTLPLILLAAGAILLGFFGTPAWPWFQGYLEGEAAPFDFGRLFSGDVLLLMLSSTIIVAAGIGLGWWLYGRKAIESAEAEDALDLKQPVLFKFLRNRVYVDEIYDASIVRFNAMWAWVCDDLDKTIWNGVVVLISWLIIALSWLNRFIDDNIINLGFNDGCDRFRSGSRLMLRFQDGKTQHYLRVIGVALILLTLFLIWGTRAS